MSGWSLGRKNIGKNCVEFSIDVPGECGECGVCHNSFCAMSDTDDACCRCSSRTSCCQNPVCCHCLVKMSLLFTDERGFKSIICKCPFCRRMCRLSASDSFLGVNKKKCASCEEAAQKPSSA